MGASFLGTLVDSSRGVERARCDQESLENNSHFYFVFIGIIDFFPSKSLFAAHLEENALLELEVLPHDVGDVGGLDGEGDGYVRLF